MCPFILTNVFTKNYSHSTDFEVHRNWLAITHSLPLSEWYTDATSPWTLDYPPIFAYFEWALSQIASHIEPEMLHVHRLNHASSATVLFQRCSVIGTDALLMLGSYRFLQAWRCIGGDQQPKQHRIAAESLLFGAVVGNFGLLLVDHIHFQYNGILFGVLLLSVAALLRGQHNRAALYFAVLLCSKHIFLYVAPVFGVYLLRYHVFESGWRRPGQACGRFVRMAAIVLVVLALAFGPFVRQLPQLAGRLFPFKRGLTHAYWAPNCWALYNAADKVLAVLLRRAVRSGDGSATAGLVGNVVHVVLPTVQPWHTFALSAAAMVPCLWRLACSSGSADAQRRQFVRALVLCGGAAFLFGWHVHEKAVLMMVVPLALLCRTQGGQDMRWLEFLTAVAHYSLFPLLDVEGTNGGGGGALTLLKYGLWLLYAVALAAGARRVHGERRPKGGWLERGYVNGLHALFVYEKVVHGWLFSGGRLPFLPLLLCSVYCALGVVYFWVRYYWAFMAEVSEDGGNVSEMVLLKEKRKKIKNK